MMTMKEKGYNMQNAKFAPCTLSTFQVMDAIGMQESNHNYDVLVL